MTDEEIAVILAEHGKEIGSLKYRMKDVESVTKSINELAISVHELTLNMRQTLDRLESHGERIKLLEKEPADNWRNMKTTIITAIIGCVVGAIIGAIIAIL